MARGWNENDPEKGVPNRHTRAKIRLLLDDIAASPQDLMAVIVKAAEKRPEDVLDAVIFVVSDLGNDRVGRRLAPVRDVTELQGAPRDADFRLFDEAVRSVRSREPKGDA